MVPADPDDAHGACGAGRGYLRPAETPTATPPAKGGSGSGTGRHGDQHLSTPEAATVQGKMIQVLASGSETGPRPWAR